MHSFSLFSAFDIKRDIPMLQRYERGCTENGLGSALRPNYVPLKNLACGRKEEMAGAEGRIQKVFVLSAT